MITATDIDAAYAVAHHHVAASLLIPRMEQSYHYYPIPPSKSQFEYETIVYRGLIETYGENAVIVPASQKLLFEGCNIAGTWTPSLSRIRAPIDIRTPSRSSSEVFTMSPP